VTLSHQSRVCLTVRIFFHPWVSIPLICVSCAWAEPSLLSLTVASSPLLASAFSLPHFTPALIPVSPSSTILQPQSPDTRRPGAPQTIIGFRTPTSTPRKGPMQPPSSSSPVGTVAAAVAPTSPSFQGGSLHTQFTGVSTSYPMTDLSLGSAAISFTHPNLDSPNTWAGTAAATSNTASATVTATVTATAIASNATNVNHSTPQHSPSVASNTSTADPSPSASPGPGTAADTAASPVLSDQFLSPEQLSRRYSGSGNNSLNTSLNASLNASRHGSFSIHPHDLATQSQHVQGEWVSELALLLSANPAHGNPQNPMFDDVASSPSPSSADAVATITVVNLAADTSPSAVAADATKMPTGTVTTSATRLLAKLGHTTSPRYPSPTPTRPGIAASSLLSSDGGGFVSPVALNARVSSLRLEGTVFFIFQKQCVCLVAAAAAAAAIVCIVVVVVVCCC
jgi:hypothetical protein